MCLLKHGIGRWMQIIDSGLLPGKLIQQLSGQTQRLVGQQSLAGTVPWFALVQHVEHLCECVLAHGLLF